MFRSFFILFSTHKARFIRGSYILFFLLIWLLLSGCLFVLLGSSEFVFYFGSVRVISLGHCCVYPFRILLGARGFPCGSLLFLSVSFRSRCFGASDGFVFLRDCLVQLVRKLGFGCLFAASFLFLFCFVYLFRTSLSKVFFFRSFSFCLFDPSVPQCRLPYENYAVDSFRASVSSLSGILIFSTRLLDIVGVTSLVLILISLSFGS